MEELHHAQVNAATKHHSPAVHSVTLTSPLQQQNAKQVLQEARCMGDWVVFTDVWCKGAKWLNSVIETLDVSAWSRHLGTLTWSACTYVAHVSIRDVILHK